MTEKSEVRLTGTQIFLGEQGPFSSFNPFLGAEAANKDTNPTLQTALNFHRGAVLSTLGISSPDELPNLLGDPRQRAKAERKLPLLGPPYGLIGLKPYEVAHALTNYAVQADSIIETITKDFFRGYDGTVEMSNTVKETHNPIGLLLMTLDPNVDPRTRFEAKRKYALVHEIAAVEQMRRREHTEGGFRDFNVFLDKYIWEKSSGERIDRTIVSKHNPNGTFECDPESIQVLTRQQADALPYEPNQLRTTKQFRQAPQIGLVYAATRQKDLIASVIKSIRRDERPEAALPDMLAANFVMGSVEQVNAFTAYFADGFARAGVWLRLVDISDTLNQPQGKNRKFVGKSAGSSSEFQAIKTTIRFQGSLLEIQFNTLETYLNSLYQRGVAHPYYEVNRLFNSGIVELLFPTEHYHYNPKQLQAAELERRRREIEERPNGYITSSNP